LSLEATGSLVHAHLHPLEGGGGWQLTWTNAGHPPPLLVRPDRRTERLALHDLLLWPGMPDSRRTDRQRLLAPGARLLLYTDGLVEQRGTDTSLAIDRAAAILAAAPANQPLPDLLQTVLGEVAGPSSRDDVVLLAVQVPDR
jgi:serine phosphatase RsbU (regulator of sigma subunit)